jgi:hypothetical protein
MLSACILLLWPNELTHITVKAHVAAAAAVCSLCGRQFLPNMSIMAQLVLLQLPRVFSKCLHALLVCSSRLQHLACYLRIKNPCSSVSSHPAAAALWLLLLLLPLPLLQRGELEVPRRRRGALASMVLNRAQDLYERGEVEASLRWGAMSECFWRREVLKACTALWGATASPCFPSTLLCL